MWIIITLQFSMLRIREEISFQNILTTEQSFYDNYLNPVLLKLGVLT